ncbi:MAG TPA: hypothetical protein ENJ95_06035 [Bacteroidetes bacterium]|nr:hypothetical protein [Bacteroidota bacterium]
MFRHIFTLCLLGAFYFNANTQTLFVKSGANGDGYSWEDPIGDLQKALRIAAPGTQIWVAKGTYTPSNCENCTPEERSQSFEIPSGVQLYGGFAGHEYSLDERKVKANATILSGNIGRDDLLDNSQTVVYFENAANTTVLDGFFIMDGYADAEGTPGKRDRSGAGIFNICTKQNGRSTPTVRNCNFMDNSAWEGAAVFNQSGKGTAAIDFNSCSFLKNKASIAGGAIADNVSAQPEHSSISDCFFVLNEAPYGGGYFTNNIEANETIFINCSFIKNNSKMGASGFLLSNYDNISEHAESCIFKNNEADNGNELLVYKGRKLPTLKEDIGASNL